MPAKYCNKAEPIGKISTFNLFGRCCREVRNVRGVCGVYMCVCVHGVRISLPDVIIILIVNVMCEHNSQGVCSSLT